MNLGNLAERIKQKRKSNGLTQAELAERLGLSEMTVRRWEANKRSPRMEEINELSKVLETPIDFFIGKDDINNTQEEPEIKQNSFDKGEQQNKINMAYWGGVVDNVQNLASSGDKDKIISVAFMLKNALSSLLNKAGVNEKGIQNFYLSNNNIFNSVFGQGATV